MAFVLLQSKLFLCFYLLKICVLLGSPLWGPLYIEIQEAGFHTYTKAIFFCHSASLLPSASIMCCLLCLVTSFLPVLDFLSSFSFITLALNLPATSSARVRKLLKLCSHLSTVIRLYHLTVCICSFPMPSMSANLSLCPCLISPALGSSLPQIHYLCLQL